MNNNILEAKPKVPLKTHVRWMIRRDMPEVLSIEASLSHPWTEEDFLRCLRQRNCIGMVGELPNEAVGSYMVYELHKNTLSVLNFAVSEAYRGQGVGTRMIDKLKSKLSGLRRTSITMIVRESNLDLQLFLRSQDFVATEVLRGHFGDEDGYWFEFSCAKQEGEAHE